MCVGIHPAGNCEMGVLTEMYDPATSEPSTYEMLKGFEESWQDLRGEATQQNGQVSPTGRR